MSTAKKFVIKIGADYDGHSEMQKLQNDLKTIGQIDSFRSLRESIKQTKVALSDAKLKARDLSIALKNGGGEEVQRQYSKATTEVKKLNIALGKQQTKFNKSRESIKKSGVVLGSLSTAYDKLKASNAGQGTVMAAQMKLGVKSIKSVNSEIDGLNRAYKTLKSSGTQSVKELAIAKDRLREKVSLLRQETSGWANHLGKFQKGWGGLLAMAGTVAVAFRGIQFFAGFDDSLRKVQAFTQSSSEELGKYSELAKGLGATTRHTATEVAEGMAELSQSGIKTYKEMAETLPVVSDLTSATGMGFKQTADMLTDTMKQFGIESSEAARVGDVIATGYSSAGHSADQLGAAISYVGPLAKQMGYSLEDTVGIINTLADAGYKGQRGGVALRGGFTRLVNPVGKAGDILDKYSIKVEDSDGKTRDFADIIEDLGVATLSTREMMILFGQEAGPGMMALVDVGADAIRDFQKTIDDSGGSLSYMAGVMEAGIGGSLRSLMSSIQAIVIAFADALAPAIQVVSDVLTVFARVVAAAPQHLLFLAGAILASGVAFTAWHLGLKHIVNAMRLASGDVKKLGTDFTNLTGKTKLAATAMKFLNVGFALVSAAMIGWEIGTFLNKFDNIKKAGIALASGLTKGFLKLKKAWVFVTGGDTAAIQREIDEAEKIYFEMFDAVGKKAIELSTTQKKAQDDVAKNARTAARKQKDEQEKALVAMQERYQQYADKVKQLQDKIASYQQSTAEKLRAMSRTGMSDGGAWEDRKKQAKEYEAAADKAMEAGNTEEAVKLYEKATDAYADLNREVKEGKAVIVSQQQALKTAMEGVEGVADKTVAALKLQEEALTASMEALDLATGGYLSETKTGVDSIADAGIVMGETLVEQINKFGVEAAEEFGIIDDYLNSAHNMIIEIEKVEKNQIGGLIGSTAQALRRGGAVMMAGGGYLNNMLGGGHFPGYGGGDRRHVIAEDGEVMVRKEAVNEGGLTAALAFNAKNWPLVVSELTKKFSLKMNLGGQVGRFSIPRLPTLAMQAGGAVSAPESMGHYTIDIVNQKAGTTIPISTNSRQNAEALIGYFESLKRSAA